MKFAHTRAAAFSTMLLLFVTFHSVAAQRTGDRVRVVIAGDTLTGDVTGRRETGFTMALSFGLMSGTTAQRDIGYAQVEKLEVRTCCKDYAWLLATGVGGLLGAIVGEETNEEMCGDNTFLVIFGSFKCEKVGNNEVWGSLIGGAVGLAVGLTFLRERWEIIPHRDRSGPSLAPLVGIRPGYGGAAMLLGARIRF